MATATVLAIGLDPSFADFSSTPELTPELVGVYIDAEIGRVREAGFKVDLHLIAPDATAEVELEAALRARSFDCVVIGAGLREPPERLLLFERILNVVHRFAPNASIAFNTTPADTAEAVQRWIPMLGLRDDADPIMRAASFLKHDATDREWRAHAGTRSLQRV